jgi:rubredoxin
MGERLDNDRLSPMLLITMARHAIFMCRQCGHIYDESIGESEAGIPPGTDFDALPDTWCCPECRAERSHFEQII